MKDSRSTWFGHIPSDWKMRKIKYIFKIQKDIAGEEGVTSPEYRVFGLIDKDNYCRQYYLYLMQMCYTNRIFYGLGQGVSGLGRWRLQADKFLNFSITVPSYEEQKEIAYYLNQKCSAIDELITKKEQYLSEI